MVGEDAPRPYVLLPLRGMTAQSSALASTTGAFFRRLAERRPPAADAAAGIDLRALDCVREDGAALVELAPAGLAR